MNSSPCTLFEPTIGSPVVAFVLPSFSSIPQVSPTKQWGVASFYVVTADSRSDVARTAGYFAGEYSVEHAIISNAVAKASRFKIDS